MKYKTEKNRKSVKQRAGPLQRSITLTASNRNDTEKER